MARQKGQKRMRCKLLSGRFRVGHLVKVVYTEPFRLAAGQICGAMSLWLEKTLQNWSPTKRKHVQGNKTAVFDVLRGKRRVISQLPVIYPSRTFPECGAGSDLQMGILIPMGEHYRIDTMHDKPLQSLAGPIRLELCPIKTQSA